MPAVGVHSSTIACSMILDEVVYFDQRDYVIYSATSLSFGGINVGIEERKEEEEERFGLGGVIIISWANFSLKVSAWVISSFGVCGRAHPSLDWPHLFLTPPELECHNSSI